MKKSKCPASGAGGESKQCSRPKCGGMGLFSPRLKFSPWFGKSRSQDEAPKNVYLQRDNIHGYTRGLRWALCRV